MYNDSSYQGLDWLDEIKKINKKIAIISEITEIQYIDRLIQTADILQIGQETCKITNF